MSHARVTAPQGKANMAKEIKPEGLFIGSERAVRLLGDRHKNLTAIDGFIALTNPGNKGMFMIGPAKSDGPFPQALFGEAVFMDRQGYGIYADAFRVMSMRRNMSRARGVTASMRIIPYTIHIDGPRRLLVPATSFLLYGNVQAIQFETYDIENPDLDDEIYQLLAETASE